MVIDERPRLEMGCPRGRHESVRAWRYARDGGSLELLFGFYANFTPYDLITKVIASGDDPAPGAGASVQFNAKRCVHEANGELALQHHGEVTVGMRISRSALVKGMRKHAGKAMALAGLHVGLRGPWPVHLGTTTNFARLLEAIFCFTYAVEQVKRARRKESALSQLT